MLCLQLYCPPCTITPPPPPLTSPCAVCAVRPPHVPRITTAAAAAGFPPGPSGDQSLGLLSDPLGTLSRLRREYGPLVGLLLGGERVVLVAEPDAAKQVTRGWG